LNFNKYKAKKGFGAVVSKQYTSVYASQNGFNSGTRVGADWRNWKLSYAFTYSKIDEYKNYFFRRSSGGYDNYSVGVILKSVINSIEISRILKIPESKYSFEIGVGMGLNYLFPDEEYTAFNSFIFDSNEYGITDNKVKLNPSKTTTTTTVFFLHFYRELPIGSIGVSVGVRSLINPYETEFYIANKFAFSIANYGLFNLYDVFTMTSFGIHYKIKLGK